VAATSEGAGRSDTGRKRTQNEDSFYVDDGLGLYVVSDGMGGHAAGEVASATAIKAVREVVEDARAAIEKVRRGELEGEALSRLAGQAVLTANQRVHELATSDRGKAGMGCTVTLVLVAGEVAALGQVGDSRLYLRRAGRIDQLSTDHTILGELVRSGVMEPDEATDDHPMAHILSRAVGTQPHVEVETLLFEVVGGDQLLLCSDGLSDYLKTTEALEEALAGEAPLSKAAVGAATEKLVAYANEAGGHDNITVVAVQIAVDEAASTRASLLSQRYDALSSVFLFQGLDMSRASRVMEACSLLEHRAGDRVVEEKALINDLYVVVDGRYLLERDGEEVGELTPGEFVGMTTLLHGRSALASVVAEGAGRMLRLTGEDLRQLVRRRPFLGIGILDRLGRRLSADLEKTYGQRAGDGAAVSASERF